MGTRGESGTMHDILVLETESIELESQFLEEVMCLSSSFNINKNKILVGCKHKHLFLTTQSVRLWVVLDSFCSTILLSPGPRQKELPSFGMCCAHGKKQKLKWPSQVR